jgi:hypothetical protein
VQEECVEGNVEVEIDRKTWKRNLELLTSYVT